MAHQTFPSDLPIPVDDGACDHLTSQAFPSISLQATSGSPVNITSQPGRTLIFCYPRTGAPSETVPDSWNSIPGARGCTPQLCGVRDSLDELEGFGFGKEQIFGLSTQGTKYQQEVAERTHLPYRILSDEKRELVDAMGLPTFEWEGARVVRRLTLVVESGKIVKVFYPVFPPDQSAKQVVEWLKEQKKS